MGSEIHFTNCWDFSRRQPAQSFDCAFIDPPYMDGKKVKTDPVDWIELQRVLMPFGDVVLFEKPGRVFPSKPSYTIEWQHPALPKNTTKKLADPREMIYIWQRGTYNNRAITGMCDANMSAVRHDVLEGFQLADEEKPFSLIWFLMELLTGRGSRVFDPFAGTGTVGAVGAVLHRDVIACENNARRYDIAKWRMAL